MRCVIGLVDSGSVWIGGRRENQLEISNCAKGDGG